MPESTPSPIPDTPRRRGGGDASDAPGSGAKILSVILALITAGLAFALFKGHSSAEQRTEADAKLLNTFTNQVNELRTRLVLEQSNADLARSNHQAMLHRRTAEVLTFSNRLVQTSLLLDHAREEARTAQAGIAERAADLATVEAHRDDLMREAAVIPGLQREVAELKTKLQQTQFAHAALQESLGRVRNEKVDLERRLDDPTYLKVQSRRAEEAAEVYRQSVAGRRVPITDKRVRLELQPDGTVRPASIVDALKEKK